MSIAIDLSDRVALVTGGTRGVGAGIAGRLVEAGATVAVCGRREPVDMDPDLDFNQCDVRDPELVDALVDNVVATHGRLDVVVNNAGGSPSTEAATASPRFSDKIIELNLTAALHVATAANRVMQARESGGAIVNVASLSGLRPSPGTAAYGAAKAGLVNLTTTLAMEWAPRVRVNAVSAGMVRTEGFEDYFGAEGAAAVADTVPLGRVAEPGDVGDAVAFLASDRAGFISGSNLVVHGGGEHLAFTRWLEGTGDAG